MLGISFACVNSRKNKSGESPIQLWINCNGSRATTYLGLRVNPSLFQKSMNSRRQNSLTQYCDAVRWRILNFYAQAASNGKPPTSQQIIEYVKNNYTERQYMLYELLDNFLRIERGRVGYEISKSTFYKLTLVTARLKEAIADKPLREVCHADILNFKHYLRNSVGLSHNTLCGYLTKAKSIFSYALDNNLISSNPFGSSW
mgnify:CR=1 FL=1